MQPKRQGTIKEKNQKKFNNFWGNASPNWMFTEYPKCNIFESRRILKKLGKTRNGFKAKVKRMWRKAERSKKNDEIK